MKNHLKVLFSNQALKAWVAGLVAVLGAYLYPIITDWINNLTPEMFTGLDQGVALFVIGAIGVIWTYITKNANA